MAGRIQIVPDDHLATLANCGGYYSCPKNSSGKRLGKLVGYAGKYEDSNGELKQYVGDVYANFSKAEKYPDVVDYFAKCLMEKLSKKVSTIIDELCGAPIGGYSFSESLARVCEVNVIKAEKKVTALATPTCREQSELFFGRHGIEKGACYGIVEDVCNNFSTTKELINLIESLGGKVSAIFCFLNRSPSVNNFYYLNPEETFGMPVFSLVRKVIEEYKQDDPAVAEDVAKGNVVWKPKDNWNALMAV